MIKRVSQTKRSKGLRWDGGEAMWVGWRCDVRVNGKRVRPNFPTRQEAEAFLATAHTKRAYRSAGIEVPPAGNVRISRLFDRVIENTYQRAAKTRAIRVFKTFSDLIGFDEKIKFIRPAHFQLFINERLKSVSTATTSREITVLSGAFSAVSRLFPFEMEGYEPPKIPRPKSNKTRHVDRRTISESEKNAIIRNIRELRLKKEKKVREAARPILADAFELAWLLGLRWGEIRGLRPEDFALSSRTLTVRRGKTKTLTVFEHMPDRAVEILKEAVKRETMLAPKISEHTSLAIIAEAIQAAGIPYGRGKFGGVTFHSTRHSFTTRLVQVTDIATAAAFTGHSDKEMVAYYSHASVESKAAAMEALYGGEDQTEEVFEQIARGEITKEDFIDRYTIKRRGQKPDKLYKVASKK